MDVASSVVQGTGGHDALRARFCIVTKGPHLHDATTLACVAARLSAFGVTVHGLRRVDGAAATVARSLYPLAGHYYDHGPTTRALWRQLSHRFDNDEFASIFGRRYDASLVVSGAEVVRRNGLSADQLIEIWETGRAPVARADLVRRYGRTAAGFVLGGTQDTYDWFRGPLPFGISRITSGMTAFAMRDERVDSGDPVIVVNGHVPGLMALFGPRTWVFDLGLDPDGVQIGDVRRSLTGDDSRPRHCLPGTLRRDAVDGSLPLGSSEAVTSRHNLIHCSDGLVAGLIELRALMNDTTPTPDLLTRELIRAGLTPPEIDRIVLLDPRVPVATTSGSLSDLTRGMDLASCVAEVIRVVPPVLGRANGHADGVDFDLLDRCLRHALVTADPLPSPAPEARPRTATVRPTRNDETVGQTAIAAGAVGVLVPAGGTGGRFGGYGVPETDPARQKSLIAAFTVAGRPMSSLDIRLANVRYWDGGRGDRVPMAVMCSATNEAALLRWREGLDDPYRRSVQVFSQHGIYRVDRDMVDDNPRQSWVDVILRDPSGQPSLKPSGGMGLLTTFILAGLLDRWERGGVTYLASANGDDVGYRLDPRIIGHLESHPDTDCVIVGVPWRFTTVRQRGGMPYRVWADEAGWSMDESGHPVQDPIPAAERTYDTGSALHTISNGPDTRLTVVEDTRPPGSLFNTNQLYVRLSAVRRALAATRANDPVTAVKRMVSGRRVAFEDKTVLLDGTNQHARQISLPLHGILPLLGRCDVVTASRHVGPGMHGSYAPLKHPADVPLAALILDALQHDGGDLTMAHY